MNIWPFATTQGVGVYVRTECLFSRCSTFHSIWYETWLISRRKCVDLLTPSLSGQGCLCVLNNCYHVAVCVVSFNFICIMKLFRKKFHFGLATSPKSTQGIRPKYPISYPVWSVILLVILLPSADSFKKGCCQLQAKVCARITGLPLVQACPGKSVVRWTDRPAMTIAVDLGRKAPKQTKNIQSDIFHI